MNDIRYKCGLVPGDRVRLRQTLLIRDSTSGAVDHEVAAGDIWKVLPTDEQGTIFFRRGDGRLHTWTDDPCDIDRWFERLIPDAT